MRRIKESIKQVTDRIEAPATPFDSVPLGAYLGFHHFDRRVKYLQTIEAIRDYAARHDGKLPTRLDALDLPAPRDPLTEKPFLYELTGQEASLRCVQIKVFDKVYPSDLNDYVIKTKKLEK